MNQDNTQPKKVKPVGGALGFFDGETEAETPLGSNSTDTFYESFKNAPFNLSDSSRPAEAFPQTAEIRSNFMGSIDFTESNRIAQETQRVNELQAEIANGGGQITFEEAEVESNDFVQALEDSKFDLSEITRIKDYVKFGEFFSIIAGEGKFGFKAIKSLFVENILPSKRNPKLEARQKMTPDQLKEENQKHAKNRNKASFFAKLKGIGGNLNMKRTLDSRRQNINIQVGLNADFAGSINEQTGEARMDLQILADKKNSEMKASELKAKKQQQMAAVSGGGKNLRTHLGAQEGQSMVANAIATAG